MPLPSYSGTNRRDLNPALETLVSPPIRQTTSQRVVELNSQNAPVVATAYLLALQTATAGAAALVGFTAEVSDTDTIHDNAVNNSRFVIPAGKPGTYRIVSRLSIDVNAGNLTDFEIRVLVNGVEVADELAGAQTADFAIQIAHEQFMNDGDYYEIQVLSSGNNSDIKPGVSTSYVSVTKQLV